MLKTRDEILFNNRYKQDIELVKNILSRHFPAAGHDKELDLEFADSYYGGLFTSFIKKSKKLNINKKISLFNKEEEDKINNYLKKHDNSSLGRELKFWYDLMKLGISVLNIYYKDDGNMKSKEEIIKYIIK